MADGNTMQTVRKIIESDEKRKYVVVSAPGKRFNGDTKVTDLLYACYNELKETGDCKQSFAKVRARFESIIKELNELREENRELRNKIAESKETELKEAELEKSKRQLKAAQQALELAKIKIEELESILGIR